MVIAAVSVGVFSVDPVDVVALMVSFGVYCLLLLSCVVCWCLRLVVCRCCLQLFVGVV